MHKQQRVQAATLHARLNKGEADGQHMAASVIKGSPGRPNTTPLSGIRAEAYRRNCFAANAHTMRDASGPCASLNGSFAAPPLHA